VQNGTALALDGKRVVSLADFDSQGVNEVYSSWLQPVGHTPLAPGRPIRR